MTKLRLAVTAAVLIGVVAVLSIDPSLAQLTPPAPGTPITPVTVVTGASAFGWLEPYVNAIVSAVILAGAGYLGLYLKTKWGVEIDAKYREAVSMFLERQAATLVSKGFVKVNGLQIDVHSEVLAKAAATAGTAIPDAIQHFGLTPDKLAEMIKAKLPTLPAVAAEVATTTTPGQVPAGNVTIVPIPNPGA